jgi:hypothetical protein
MTKEEYYYKLDKGVSEALQKTILLSSTHQIPNSVEEYFIEALEEQGFAIISAKEKSYLDGLREVFKNNDHIRELNAIAINDISNDNKSYEEYFD